MDVLHVQTCISGNMRNLICQFLIKNGRKIALIADESTSVSNTSRLIIYIRALIHEIPENMFLYIVNWMIKTQYR